MPARRAAARARHATTPAPSDRGRLLRGIAHGLLVEALAVGVILALVWAGARL